MGHGVASTCHMIPVSRQTGVFFFEMQWGELQGYIESLHRIFCILRGRVKLSNAIQAQILAFVDPQLVKLMTGETPPPTMNPDPNSEQCVLKLDVYRLLY